MKYEGVNCIHTVKYEGVNCIHTVKYEGVNCIHTVKYEGVHIFSKETQVLINLFGIYFPDKNALLFSAPFSFINHYIFIHVPVIIMHKIVLNRIHFPVNSIEVRKLTHCIYLYIRKFGVKSLFKEYFIKMYYYIYTMTFSLHQRGVVMSSQI